MGVIGSGVRRVEDPRFLTGKGQYVDDLRLPGMVSVAFVRSPHAHARIKAIDAKPALSAPGVVEVMSGAEAARLAQPLGLEFLAEAVPGYKKCQWHCIAVDKARYVGDIVAAVVGENRYIAEDGAEAVEVDYEVLPVVSDPERALEPGAPRVHDEWGDNIMLRTQGEAGSVDEAFARAACVIRERFKTNRHCALPLETRGCVAAHEAFGEGITLWTSTQMPHMVRSRLAAMMGYPEHKIRVIGPDVGGGFGLKCHVFPEELIVCLLARKLGRPVKWIEDRRENLTSSFHAKEEIVYAELALDSAGTILGAKARFICDVGAYSADPWPSSFEPMQAAAAFPGPYKVPSYRYETLSVATNKSTLSTYRGVGLPVATFVMERLLDMGAQRLGMDPAEIRRRNMVRSEEFPYTTVTGLVYDSGSNVEALEKALAALGYNDLREEQQKLREKGRYVGIGIASYEEMAVFGSRYWEPLGVRNSGYDSATVRVDPSGGVTLSVGTFSHGQGHATTYAQLVADELGVAVEDVRFLQGDTATTPYGWGTWGSRSAVAGGGAVIRASRTVREKILRVAAHLLEVGVQDLEPREGVVEVKGAPGRRLALKEIAQAAVYSAWKLPKSEDPGLEATVYYDPPPLTFANATHAAAVEVDVETGSVKILKYVVVEDCGRIINPMIVAGQIHGGVAQGLGNALLEHLVYDENGQLLTTTLMDYLIPTAAETPEIIIDHIETPSPFTEHGIKGMGEGGAIAPPACIANAVADALSPFGAKVTGLPLSPEYVRQLVQNISRS